MMKIFYYSCAVIVFGFAFIGCKNNERQQQSYNADSVKERMINVNKTMVGNETARITDFISRHQWKMDSTGTGLRYWIYTEGSGASPKANDKVAVNYKLSLLDGEVLYQYEKEKPLRFTMGRGESTTGLEEALALMKPGAKARLIVPKYLGYGMTGDGNKIPGNATLVYDVELNEVTNTKN